VNNTNTLNRGASRCFVEQLTFNQFSPCKIGGKDWFLHFDQAIIEADAAHPSEPFEVLG